MTSKYHKTMSSCWILVLTAILNTLSQSCVEGLRTRDNDKASYGLKPIGTLKTIKVSEDGDVIDCVDIYKQPAFDNPLIKELKAVPSSIANAFNKTRYPQPKFLQTWNKYGECPKGTIPIRRTLNNGTIHRKVYDVPEIHEYATVSHRAKVQGGKAEFNVWKPQVAREDEFSVSQLWLAAGKDPELNTIEVGWIVYPKLYHDARPRLFIYWTNDSYTEHGCYNLICDGFVQRNNQIALGSGWEPASVYGGAQVVEQFAFLRARDREGGDWWLIIGEYVLGYYPRTLFPYLGDGADDIQFGGEIINLQSNNRHTYTAMGSGSFSALGIGRACRISHIQVANDEFAWVESHLEIESITRPTCYDLTIGPPGTDLGSHFYFGGPGLSRHCR